MVLLHRIVMKMKSNACKVFWHNLGNKCKLLFFTPLNYTINTTATIYLLPALYIPYIY